MRKSLTIFKFKEKAQTNFFSQKYFIQNKGTFGKSSKGSNPGAKNFIWLLCCTCCSPSSSSSTLSLGSGREAWRSPVGSFYKIRKMQIHLYAFKITIFIEAKKTRVGRPARHCLKGNIFDLPTFPIKKFLKLVKQIWVAISYVGLQHRFFFQQQQHKMMMTMINAPIPIPIPPIQYQISNFAFSEISDGVREVEEVEEVESSLVSSK